MAGALGFEPRPAVLETAMLAITEHTPVVPGAEIESATRGFQPRALPTELSRRGVSDGIRTRVRGATNLCARPLHYTHHMWYYNAIALFSENT